MLMVKFDDANIKLEELNKGPRLTGEIANLKNGKDAAYTITERSTQRI